MNIPSPRRRLARWITAAVGALATAAGLTAFATPAQAAVDTGAWYAIVNEHSGLALDIESAGTANGDAALLWTRTDAANQQWRFLDSGNGYYRVQARHSGLVLDVYAKSTENGADIVQWADNGGANQQWQVNEQSDGTVELVNRHSGKALDNWEWATEPGSRVSQYDRNGLTTQRWNLIEVSGGGDGGQTGDGSVSDPNLQYYGRWAADGSWRTMGWAGGYVEAAFTGSSIGVRLRSTIDLWYSVDGAAEQWRRNASGNVTIASGLSGAHTVRIGFRERAGSYTGDPAFGGFVLASGGSTAPIERPADFIEFIGDSITVGQPNGDRPFTTYPYLVGEALGAGHTQVAQGGACLVSQDCYGMMDWFRRSSAWVGYDDWDFSTHQATAVVINLGTNDIGHDVSTTQFYGNYIVMLERVRQAYPDAEIFAMGVFRNRYVTETRNAVQVRIDAGDDQVHFVDTGGWVDPATDTWDNVHPTDAGHRKIANLLTPIIDQYL